MFFERQCDSSTVLVNLSKPSTICSIATLHYQLGHLNEKLVREVAKSLGYTLKSGTMPVCEACEKAKAQQKTLHAIEDEAIHVEMTLGERRIYLDMAKLKAPAGASTITNNNWRIMVDEATQLKFSAFFPTKAAMVEPKCKQLSRWQAAGFPVQYLRMDNAGENKALEKAMNGKDWKLNITPEYTARNSPQQNHLAEIAIAVIGNKARAMMIASNIPMVIRYKLARKAIETATKLDGLTPITLGGVTLS